MSVSGRWLRIGGLMLVVAVPVALGASCLAEGDRYSWLAVELFHGPLVLVAAWSALASTPIYIRWPCGYLALWLACPQLGPAFIAHVWPNDVWRTLIAWQVVPQVLLIFSLLAILREFGLRLESRACGLSRPSGDLRGRFTLRQLFAWVAGAAVLSLAWQKAVAAVFAEVGYASPFRPWRMIADGMISDLTLTALDIVAIWAVLGTSRVRWRLALLLIVVIGSQTLAWQYVLRVPFGLTLHTEALDADADRIRIYSRICLLPMMFALGLVRSGGYRWTAAHSLSP